MQFDELQSVHNIDVWPIWQTFVDRFPTVTEMPPLFPVFEIFGQTNSLRLPPMDLGRLAAAPRYWFSSLDETQIVQFQRDRFAHNWRKRDDSSPYPRYELIRAAFQREWRELNELIQKRHGVLPTPNQCEITYVNIIQASDPAADMLPQVLECFREIRSDGLQRAERSAVKSQWVVEDAGRPVARLYAEAGSTKDPAGTPIVQFTLTVRGPASAPTEEAVLSFMDMGRKRIVTAFAELTTRTMHTLWGRTD